MKKAGFGLEDEIGITLREARDSKLRCFRVAAVALILGLMLTAQSAYAQGTQKYVNGLWFNGLTFEQRTVYVIDGVFKLKHSVDDNNTTIDLHGQFVIPPFAEAHNHNFGEEANSQQQLNQKHANAIEVLKKVG